MRSRPHTIYAVLVILLLLACPLAFEAQKRKKRTVKKPVRSIPVYTLVASGSASDAEYKPEPILSLEPCAKETPEQIAELESGTNSTAQVNLLVKRTLSEDKWVRGCAIYRLGEFGSAGTDALPVILKMVDEEEDSDLWNLANLAMWRISPTYGFSLDERIRDAKSPEKSKQLYAVFSLAYTKYLKGSNEAKRSLSSLIETLSDPDPTIVYIATIGIQRQGYWGEDTSRAIPALSDLIRAGRINPVHPVDTMRPMGLRAAPAAPLLMEIFLEPKKFIKSESDVDIRAYSLSFSAKLILGQFGSDFIPVLEKYRNSHPYKVLSILSRMSSQESLDLTLEIARTSTGKLRAEAIESIPTLKPSYAVKVAPTLLQYLSDRDKDIREKVIVKLGSFARSVKDPPEDFRTLYKKQVVPKLVALLNDKKSGCYAALTLPDIGDDAAAAIPALARIARRPTGSGCARKGLYDFGEAGRKHLTAEQIKEEEESSKFNYGLDRNKPKEIKPKKGEANKAAVPETY